MRIELACEACGGNRFAFPEGGEDAVVTCSDCGGSVGTLRALRKQIERALLSKRNKMRRPL